LRVLPVTISTFEDKQLPSSETCWALLERVAAGSQLARSARLRELLFFVGKRTLKDGCDQLHEQEIGVEVFGRTDGYNTSVDTIVRVSASELRKRIENYFETEGLHEPVIMEIPRGNYIPVFRNRTVEPKKTTQPPVPAVAPIVEPFDAALEVARTSGRRRWMIAILIMALLAGGCVALWMQNRAVHRSLYAWQYKPSVSAFWSGILDARPDTDIVMADSSYSLVQLISKKSFSFQDYLSRNYVNQLQGQDLSPEMRSALTLIAAKNLESASDFRLAQRIVALDPVGKSIHMYFAREYMPALIKQDNVILIGSPIANPWDELFESRMNFTVIPDSGSPTYITNRAPAPGEQSTYTPSASMGYCTVAYLPNPDHNGSVLLLEGTGSEATEAAGDFLLSEEQLSSFQKTLHVKKFPYFEVLLKTSQVKGTPLSTTLVAYRTYPAPH